MVRGRVYVTNGFGHRRSASVPVDDFRPAMPDSATINKAHLISSHAVQDADAITSKSRQHDREFLASVANRMAAANSPQTYVHNSTPVYIGSRYPAPPTHLTMGDYRRKTYAPAVSDYEVANYLAHVPSRPYIRNSRAGSVPPPSAPRSYPPTVTHGPTTPRWGYPTNRPYNRQSLAPYEDVVVGVAHTSLYGDIVIGIPYNKKHIFDAEFDGTNNYGGNNYKRHSYAPPQVSNRYSVSAYSTVPTVTSVPPRPSAYRRASVAVPYKNIYDDYEDIVSPPPPRYRGSVATKRYDPMEYEVDWPTRRPTETVNSLKGRAQSVQRQLGGIPEFHVYNPSAPRAASVAPTYGTSSYGAPTHGASSYGGGSSSAGAGLPPAQPRQKRPVSEARRKVRDVLCRSKNNPHYFED